ncbi:MAG: M48 family metallopeptidase [Flavobacteriales bacterium]
MQRRLFTDFLKILIPFLLLWVGFAYLPVFKGGAGDLISVEREEALGDKVVNTLFEETGMLEELEDKKVKGAIRRIEGRLVEEVGLTDYEYNVRIIESEKVNAFTLPGGHIIVCSGLIEFAQDPEEVASVLAHEIGHVEKRHVIDRLVREIGKGTLFSVMGGSAGSSVAKNILTNSISAGFNRQQEREADDYALRLLEKSRIAPKNMGELFKRLREKKYDGTANLVFLKSHPDINSRIKKAEQYQTGPDFETDPFKMDWEAVQKRLKEENEEK